MQRNSTTTRKEKRLRTRALIFSILLLAIIFPAVRFGPRVYSRWEQHRLTAQARELLQNGDYKRASICLRQAIELNPSNVQATRLFAELAEKAGKTEAVSLRERVSLLAPDSFDDAYAWASSALRFGDTSRVQEAVAIMQRTGANRGGYHEILARIALNSGKLVEARSQFAEALKAEPQNEMFQLEAATMDIQSGDPAIQQQARQSLERLRSVPERRINALRTLIAAYATRGGIAAALPLAKELATDPKATIQDKLIYLSVLHGYQSQGFANYLSELQESVKASPSDAALLVTWLNGHRLAMLSHEWVARLPQEMTSKPPLALKLAETYILVSDWNGLQALASSSNWGDLEYMRLAFLSLALSKKGDVQGSDTQWKAAIAATAKRPERLGALEKTSAAWHWDARLEDLRWFIAKNSKHPEEALKSLADRYRRAQDTRNLHRVISSLLELDPKNTVMKNNWAMLSLLLHTDMDQAAQAAQELYEAHPTDPHVAATYGFALYMTNRTDDALEVMRKLPRDQLRVPAIAGYYGVMLAAIRDPEAMEFLDLAKGQKLLPEEEQVFAKARRLLSEP